MTTLTTGCTPPSQDISVSDDDDSTDQHGIPTSVKHASQNAFTLVWSFIHKPAVPIPDPVQPGRPFTHVCLVCADKGVSLDPTSTTWMTCLMRHKTSSNAKKHMLRVHPDHTFSVEAAAAKIACTTAKIQTHDANLSSNADTEQPKLKKQRTLHEAVSITADEIRILTTRWLLASGLPYTVLENDELLVFVRRLSNQPRMTLPARETFYEFVEGEFAVFVQHISRVLRIEYDSFMGQPFLAVLHDLWTNAANVSIIGVTLTFIDVNWRLRTIYALALPNSRGHAAAAVADSIKLGMESRYGVDINSYARFTVSDTTGSAKNVSDHFDCTDQVDCLMHLLSLCLVYGLGLKENRRDDGRLIVTPGGEFEMGAHVIQKLRDLATFFNSPQRLLKLNQLKEIYSLPEVNISIDGKTRVGYAVTLMRRRVYNYCAFTKYFDTAPRSEQAVWEAISLEDWNLITEMESVTDQLAQFSLGEVQRDGVASSYALLFRKMLTMALESESFESLVLERPQSRGNEFSQRRVRKLATSFSPGGKRCLARLKGQLALRFPEEDINEIKSLLLDPRIKSKAAGIVSDPDALTRAECELQLQHDDIYIKLAQRDVSIGDVLDTAPDATPTFMAPHRTINSSFSSLLDVEVPTETDEVRSAHDDLHLKARNIWNQWKKLSVKWSCTSKDGKYNLLHLYREVDVLAWFRKHGERDFPSIAILARIYLGKPLSTAPQERFFSQSGYVVNELRTRLDDDRAEQMCLLRANWSEYKQF